MRRLPSGRFGKLQFGRTTPARSSRTLCEPLPLDVKLLPAKLEQRVLVRLVSVHLFAIELTLVVGLPHLPNSLVAGQEVLDLL